MTKASDNPYPSLLIVEGSAPASPSAGDQRLYIDSADHHLKRKNSSGTVTDLESGSSATATAHAARATRASTNFSVGSNTLTAIQFDAEDYDTDTMHDNSSNTTRLTIPTISGVTTGLWIVTASGYTDSTSGRSDVLIKVNGSTPIAFVGSQSAAVLGAYTAAVSYVFTAADYVECLVRTTAGAGNVVFDAGVSPIFTISFLGKVS